MAYAACVELPEIDALTSLTMPGIGELTFMRDTLASMPRLSDQLIKILNIMSPALAPVYSLIRVLDIIIAITDCVKAIPKSLPFNPQPLIECFTNLFEAIAALVALLPPFAYVRLIADLVSIMRRMVEDMINTLVILDNEVTLIKRTIAKAITNNDVTLLQIGNCAQLNLNKTSAGIMQVLEVVSKLMLAVISILEMIASVIPGPIGDKISEWSATIAGIQASFGGGASLEDYPPFQTIIETLVDTRNVLGSIETFCKLVLGLPFSLPELTQPVLENA